MAVRILHVATRHRVGGAERNLLHTVSHELDRGFEVHVAVGTEDLQDDFPAPTRVHPLCDLVRDVSPIADRRALNALRALVRDHEFEVVQTHQSKAGALGRMAAHRFARVVLHTVHMASFGPAYGGVQSQLFLRLERRLARFTDRFIFVGATLQSRYEAARVATPERSAIVRSPITNLESLIGLRARADQRDRARAALGVPAHRRVVLMVGALDRRKRHVLAVTALTPLLLEGKTHVLIAGEGPERGAIEARVRDLGVEDSVRLLGFVGDVTPLYAAADVFVQTSALEGVPQTVVQSIAAGVPVIATEVDGVTEAAPGPPHVAILPPDGRGLLEATRAALAATHFSPAPPERLTGWLPETVDAQLDMLHDWIEERVCWRRSLADTSPSARAPSPAVPIEEMVVR